MSRAQLVMRWVLPFVGVSGAFLSCDRSRDDALSVNSPIDKPRDWLSRLVRRLNTALLD